MVIIEKEVERDKVLNGCVGGTFPKILDPFEGLQEVCTGAIESDGDGPLPTFQEGLKVVQECPV